MGVAAVLAAAVLLFAGSAAGQTLTVNATKFYNNDPVTVTLSGVAAPTVNDSVALFLASAATPDTLRPIKCGIRAMHELRCRLTRSPYARPGVEMPKHPGGCQEGCFYEVQHRLLSRAWVRRL